MSFLGETSIRMGAAAFRLVETLVDRTLGTAIGNMTEIGGLAASFDGIKIQNAASSSRATDNNATKIGYIGKDWGSGTIKLINKFAVTCPSDSRFDGGGSTINVTLNLEGSNDNSSWSELSSNTVSNNSYSQTITVSNGIDITTKYRYHRVKISHTSLNNRIYNSELEFWELVPD